jgi:alcohol dehydrogenase class IV
MLPTLSYLTDIHFGPGKAAAVSELTRDMAIRRPMIVTDAGLIGAGVIDRLRVESATIYDGVLTNPTEAQVLEAVATYREAGCDGIIAVGGGSSLDLAKCAGLLIGHEPPLRQYAILEGGVSRIRDRIPKWIAVPTTAGSGSEVGRAALATLETGEKLGFLSPYLLPAAAICDPELTVSMPPWVTAGTGMDAISHCVETFCSPRWNPAADALALDGFLRGMSSLRSAFGNGADIGARSEMMVCSLMGGLAFQKSLGAVHSLSHPLGGLQSVRLHHGTLNGLFLPVVLEFNTNACKEKLDALAAGIGLSSGADLPDAFRSLLEDLGLPLRLGDLGVTDADVVTMAPRAAADHCTPTNPRPLDEAACLELYRRVL